MIKCGVYGCRREAVKFYARFDIEAVHARCGRCADYLHDPQELWESITIEIYLLTKLKEVL